MLGHAMAASWRDASARLAVARAARGAAAAGTEGCSAAALVLPAPCAEEDEYHHAERHTERLLHFKWAAARGAGGGAGRGGTGWGGQQWG
jgi:hypothetical protein